ncbi:hypothetical protein GCM10023238_28580 [Streptomyces heliomycini]
MHISTDEVYGSIDEGSWPETHPLEPNSPYSSAKASSDLIALSTTAPTAWTSASPAAPTTTAPPLPREGHPLFVTNLLDGKKVPLYGDGGNVRDWLHIDDHVQGIELVRTKGRAGEIYNIGGGTELSNKELTGLLLEACGADWRPASSTSRTARATTAATTVDCTKIREELATSPARTSARASPRPSGGTATTVPGGSR